MQTPMVPIMRDDMMRAWLQGYSTPPPVMPYSSDVREPVSSPTPTKSSCPTEERNGLLGSGSLKQKNKSDPAMRQIGMLM